MEIIAWAFAILFGGAFFATTKADIVNKTPEHYTLGYWTTPYVSTAFDFAFDRMAVQICPDGYKVIDKTNRPGEATSSQTRWVITCEDKK